MGVDALTEWRPFSPINDHRVICTQYLFGRRDLCSCQIEFCTKVRASRNDPLFFFKLKSSLKDPFFFIVLTKWPPIFLLSSLKDPLSSLFSLSPKDPYFGGRVCTSPSLPYVSAPSRDISLTVLEPVNRPPCPRYICFSASPQTGILPLRTTLFLKSTLTWATANNNHANQRCLKQY